MTLHIKIHFLVCVITLSGIKHVYKVSCHSSLWLLGQRILLNDVKQIVK